MDAPPLARHSRWLLYSRLDLSEVPSYSFITWMSPVDIPCPTGVASWAELLRDGRHGQPLSGDGGAGK